VTCDVLQVLRIGFHSQEAVAAARSGIDAATFVLEPRTDAVHDEIFVARELADRGFASFILSISPIARHRFLLRFVHVNAAASAMEFLQSHRLFQVRNRASGAAAAVLPRP
jgi:hypothetical protein